jgi:hypothetical protein
VSLAAPSSGFYAYGKTPIRAGVGKGTIPPPWLRSFKVKDLAVVIFQVFENKWFVCKVFINQGFSGLCARTSAI